MPFEKGGRADKQGNRYEINCIIYEILKVLNEINYAKEVYIDVKSMMKQFEERTICLISFWLRNKIKSQGTANSSKAADKQIATKCLDLWDIMFERQLGSVREVSRKLMER